MDSWYDLDLTEETDGGYETGADFNDDGSVSLSQQNADDYETQDIHLSREKMQRLIDAYIRANGLAPIDS